MLSHPNLTPVLTTRLVEKGAFRQDPFRLIDVGCAGGIETQWRVFPLDAVAIDPMTAEIERLTGLEQTHNVRYVSAFVKSPNYPTKYEREHGAYNPNARSSAQDAASRTTYNAWNETKLSETEITLDDAAAMLTAPVDFIKTDTDGGDLEVLKSGTTALKSTLGVSVEVVFHGTLHPLSNVWRNVDRFMVESGLELFDMELRRYSRVALPDRFTWGAAGETDRGQVIWAQCLYLRDFIPRPELEPPPPPPPPPGEIRKLACIFEIFNLNDCAAELIQAFPDAFTPYVKVDQALDMLTREWLPEYKSYKDLQKAYQSDYRNLYPDWAKQQTYAWDSGSPPAAQG